MRLPVAVGVMPRDWLEDRKMAVANLDLGLIAHNSVNIAIVLAVISSLDSFHKIRWCMSLLKATKSNPK